MRREKTAKIKLRPEQGEGYYYPGTNPIPNTVWLVENFDGKKLGEITVRGSEVSREMDKACVIKGHVPVPFMSFRLSKQFDSRSKGQLLFLQRMRMVGSVS